MEIKVANWYDRDEFIEWCRVKHPGWDIKSHNSNYDAVNGYFVYESDAGGKFALSLMQELYEEFAAEVEPIEWEPLPEKDFYWFNRL